MGNRALAGCTTFSQDPDTNFLRRSFWGHFRGNWTKFQLPETQRRFSPKHRAFIPQLIGLKNRGPPYRPEAGSIRGLWEGTVSEIVAEKGALLSVYGRRGPRDPLLLIELGVKMGGPRKDAQDRPSAQNGPKWGPKMTQKRAQKGPFGGEAGSWAWFWEIG